MSAEFPPRSSLDPASPLNASWLLPFNLGCVFSPAYSPTFLSFNLWNVLVLLPLCASVLRRALTAPPGPVSHSDSFTFHLTAMELVGVCGSMLSALACALPLPQPTLLLTGVALYTFSFTAELFFHSLTCVERYLAVVRPVLYLGLKKERWIRRRNLGAALVWLSCLAETVLFGVSERGFFISNLLLIQASLLVVSFCSVSVLRVLVAPGPAGARERPGGARRRAFHTILTILSLLLLRFCWDLIWAGFHMSGVDENCSLVMTNFWLNLPSSAVLPLIYIWRVWSDRKSAKQPAAPSC